MFIFLQKKNFTVLALATLFISTSALASDLTDDLKTPFNELTNPFHGEVKSLPSKYVAPLSQLIKACAYTPVKAANNEHDEAALKNDEECTAIQLSSFTGDSYFNQAVVEIGGSSLTFIAWDADDSDGWDEQAIGVYNESGKRIAIADRHVIGNMIDGIAALVGVALPEKPVQ